MVPKDSQLRRGVLELAILTLLGARPHYGGAIVSNLSSRQGLESGAGTVYPLLTRLSNSGYVSTTWQESPSGPPRKYYQLTPQGTKHLAHLSQTWSDLVSSMTDLMREGNP
ncbi:PadR family transcriptional regulator [Flaviflexus massiliensis]|uniref:PadR family transcriptional regulator n=1 Tax=Flaviflexus massiliensis TaxID=1522309 RepID=UPI0006D5509F|nr:PadR family transcriptional regulator [Flaviflexus massiliensis]